MRTAASLAARPNIPPFRIVIVGDGPERETLSRLAVRTRNSKPNHLAGFQRDTKPYYAMAAVVAVPSHSEGSPNVVLEAMAAGLPIVSNRVGGVPEILEDGVTGLMVEPLRPEAMANALSGLLNDADLRARLGAAAQASAASAHTPEAYRPGAGGVLSADAARPAELNSLCRRDDPRTRCVNRAHQSFL